MRKLNISEQMEIDDFIERFDEDRQPEVVAYLMGKYGYDNVDEYGAEFDVDAWDEREVITSYIDGDVLSHYSMEDLKIYLKAQGYIVGGVSELKSRLMEVIEEFEE